MHPWTPTNVPWKSNVVSDVFPIEHFRFFREHSFIFRGVMVEIYISFPFRKFPRERQVSGRMVGTLASRRSGIGSRWFRERWNQATGRLGRSASPNFASEFLVPQKKAVSTNSGVFFGFSTKKNGPKGYHRCLKIFPKLGGWEFCKSPILDPPEAPWWESILGGSSNLASG